MVISRGLNSGRGSIHHLEYSMAMTNLQQTEAYQFFAIAFGATPGVEYMNQLDEAYSAGLTTQQIVNIYTTKPAFTALYPTFFSSEQ